MNKIEKLEKENKLLAREIAKIMMELEKGKINIDVDKLPRSKI